MVSSRKLTKKELMIKNRVRDVASRKGLLYKETLMKKAAPFTYLGGAAKGAVRNTTKKGGVHLGNAYAKSSKPDRISWGRVATGVGLGGLGVGMYTLR